MKPQEEYSKGELNQKRIIDEYDNLIATLAESLGVLSAYIGAQIKYDMVSEKTGFSTSYVSQTIQKYLRGEIKF